MTANAAPEQGDAPDLITNLRALLSEREKEIERLKVDLRRALEDAKCNAENFSVTNKALVDYDRKRILAEERAERAEQDAKRYRWLREHGCGIESGDTDLWNANDALDAAIDAALAARED